MVKDRRGPHSQHLHQRPRRSLLQPAPTWCAVPERRPERWPASPAPPYSSQERTGNPSQPAALNRVYTLSAACLCRVRMHNRCANRTATAAVHVNMKLVEVSLDCQLKAVSFYLDIHKVEARGSNYLHQGDLGSHRESVENEQLQFDTLQHQQGMVSKIVCIQQTSPLNSLYSNSRSILESSETSASNRSMCRTCCGSFDDRDVMARFSWHWSLCILRQLLIASRLRPRLYWSWDSQFALDWEHARYI